MSQLFNEHHFETIYKEVCAFIFRRRFNIQSVNKTTSQRRRKWLEAFGLEFLGFTFTPNGLLPSAKHTTAVSQYQAPQTVKEVCTFLGLVNYFKRHIPDRATLFQPLTDLTCKDKVFEWTEECEKSFQKAKTLLTSQPLMAYPRFNDVFYLATDASTIAVGGCLMQHNRELDCLQPVAYCGQRLDKHQRNYSITKLGLLALVYCVQYFRVYLQNTIEPFIVFTDHSALLPILQKNINVPQLARFALILQSYNFKAIHVKGKLNSAYAFSQ